MNTKFLVSLLIVIIVITGGLFLYNNLNQTVEEPKPAKEAIIDEVEVVKEPIIEEVEAPETQETADISIGQLAPDFTLKNLSGEEVSLSDYRGKIVLLNFWATWCGYCDIEMPDLNTVDMENDDLVVLAVDVMEEKSVVEEYINSGGYEFQVVLDEEGEVMRTYLVSGFPTSYFIDKEGILLGGVPGMLTYEQMNAYIDSVRDKEE